MIAIKNICKSFGTFCALQEINLEIADGELVALLGPSGCGKTTLLRILAGLESIDKGEITINEEKVSGVPPQDRKMGFVFQHFALFRHMTVFDNIAFGMTVLPPDKRPSKEAIKKRVTDLLRLIQMEWLSDYFPGKLSGGQRQRVALARALAIEPSVLLLDEPFSSLDATVRRELRRWLKKMHDDLHITSIFVTHDQEEALEVASRVVVMNKGKIEQIGTPEHIYDHPANQFVYEFLGDVNIFSGRINKGSFDFHGAQIHSPGHIDVLDAKAIGCIRPDEIELKRESAPGLIPATIVSIRPAGPIVRVELQREDTDELVLSELKRNVFRSLALHKHEKVYLNIAELKVFVDKGNSI